MLKKWTLLLAAAFGLWSCAKDFEPKVEGSPAHEGQSTKPQGIPLKVALTGSLQQPMTESRGLVLDANGMIDEIASMSDGTLKTIAYIRKEGYGFGQINGNLPDYGYSLVPEFSWMKPVSNDMKKREFTKGVGRLGFALLEWEVQRSGHDISLRLKDPEDILVFGMHPENMPRKGETWFISSISPIGGMDVTYDNLEYNVGLAIGLAESSVLIQSKLLAYFGQVYNYTMASLLTSGGEQFRSIERIPIITDWHRVQVGDDGVFGADLQFKIPGQLFKINLRNKTNKQVVEPLVLESDYLRYNYGWNFASPDRLKNVDTQPVNLTAVYGDHSASFSWWSRKSSREDYDHKEVRDLFGLIDKPGNSTYYDRRSLRTVECNVPAGGTQSLYLWMNPRFSKDYNKVELKIHPLLKDNSIHTFGRRGAASTHFYAEFPADKILSHNAYEINIDIQRQPSTTTREKSPKLPEISSGNVYKVSGEDIDAPTAVLAFAAPKDADKCHWVKPGEFTAKTYTINGESWAIGNGEQWYKYVPYIPFHRHLASTRWLSDFLLKPINYEEPVSLYVVPELDEKTYGHYRFMNDKEPGTVYAIRHQNKQYAGYAFRYKRHADASLTIDIYQMDPAVRTYTLEDISKPSFWVGLGASTYKTVTFAATGYKLNLGDNTVGKGEYGFYPIQGKEERDHKAYDYVYGYKTGNYLSTKGYIFAFSHPNKNWPQFGYRYTGSGTAKDLHTNLDARYDFSNYTAQNQFETAYGPLRLFKVD